MAHNKYCCALGLCFHNVRMLDNSYVTVALLMVVAAQVSLQKSLQMKIVDSSEDDISLPGLYNMAVQNYSIWMKSVFSRSHEHITRRETDSAVASFSGDPFSWNYRMLFCWRQDKDSYRSYESHIWQKMLSIYIDCELKRSKWKVVFDILKYLLKTSM